MGQIHIYIWYIVLKIYNIETSSLNCINDDLHQFEALVLGACMADPLFGGVYYQIPAADSRGGAKVSHPPNCPWRSKTSQLIQMDLPLADQIDNIMLFLAIHLTMLDLLILITIMNFTW